MSWIQKLYETYEQCAGHANTGSETALKPLYHAIQQAHIEIAVNNKGDFRRATVITKENTVIPATEKSATARTSAVVPHPLCDHVKYCAGDYKEGDERQNKYFESYRDQLRRWCKSEYSHPKAVAVLKYIEKETVIKDLVKEGIMPVDADGRLRKTWPSKEDKPQLFKQLTPEKGAYKPQNALIRWRVELPNDPAPEVWKDATLQDAWISYCTAGEETKTVDLCMVTGIKRPLADKHPNRLRGGKDNAKLISNKKEEDSDFIYLGRFLKVTQAAGVGIDISQKAHSALQWLIKRQGFRNGDQVIVAWAVGGKEIPDPFKNSADMIGLDFDENETASQSLGDAGQTFALRLNKYIAGYRTELGSTNDIVVMGLDSATPGRMAITFYRELAGSEFLDRVQAWHEKVAWHQHYSKEIRFVGAPSPKEIGQAAYGQRNDESLKKLHKATVERLLPCIIDGQAIPRDLMEATIRRTCNRAGLEHWEFEKNLGIACALFKGYFKERSYHMALEQDRTTRDYLYGRLLAVAERIENWALYLAGEERDTNAAKYMQRFADRPYSTWRTIELLLPPYKSRLRSKDPVFLHEKERLIDEIVCAFDGEDFKKDDRLTGEFLLGYHCQRQVLYPPPRHVKTKDNNENQIREGE
jgi:CRISPR-associated protein Csd1